MHGICVTGSYTAKPETNDDHIEVRLSDPRYSDSNYEMHQFGGTFHVDKRDVVPDGKEPVWLQKIGDGNRWVFVAKDECPPQPAGE